MPKMQQVEHHGTYEDLANEYYDATRHPTCANFFELSNLYLRSQLNSLELEDRAILEMGCGKSIVAPILLERKISLKQLTLLDSSPKMLRHSSEWEPYGARLLVADARNTGLPSSEFGLIVSSLGDPYNVPDFWSEVKRLLAQGGVCLFTTPAREWAVRFRDRFGLEEAEFLRADGKLFYLPSTIPTPQDQAQMLAFRNLKLGQVIALSSESLSQAPSPKLLITRNTAHDPIVRGYRIEQDSAPISS